VASWRSTTEACTIGVVAPRCGADVSLKPAGKSCQSSVQRRTPIWHAPGSSAGFERLTDELAETH
jgi:hypothetical protein